MFTLPAPVLSLGSDLRSLSLSSQPPPTQRVSRQASQAGECWPTSSSVRESLRFALCTPVAALSSVAPKLPPSATRSLCPRRGFLVCETFPPSQLPPTGAGPIPNFCLCYFFFLLPYPGTWGSFLPFGKSEVFCQCSVGVL